MAQKRRSKRITKPKRKKAPKPNYVMPAPTGRYGLTGFDAEMEKLITALRQAGESKLADELTEDKDAFKSRDPKKIKRLLENLNSIIDTKAVVRAVATPVVIKLIKGLIKQCFPGLLN